MTDETRITITIDRLSWNLIRSEIREWLLNNQTSGLYGPYKGFPGWLDKQVGDGPIDEAVTVSVKRETYEAASAMLKGNHLYAWTNLAVHPKPESEDTPAIKEAAKRLREEGH